MPRLHKRGRSRETDVFAHLTSTSTTPPSSSDLIAAWIHQLPTPSAITLPSNLVHSHLLHQPLASISPNPQRLSPTNKSQQKQPLAYGSQKRRATSPSLSAPSPLRPLWPRATANSTQCPARRSIRLAQTRYQMPQSAKSSGKQKATLPVNTHDHQATSSGHQEGTDDNAYMMTRGRVRQGLPQTPSRQTCSTTFPIFTPNAPSHPSESSSHSACPRPLRKQASSKAPPTKESGSPTKSATDQSTDAETASSISVAIKNKEQLGEMLPPVTFSYRYVFKEAWMPAPVLKLWMEYIASAINAIKVIPEERRAMLEERYNTPMKSNTQIVAEVYAKELYSPIDLDTVVAKVNAVLTGADDNRGRCHESQWIAEVCAPLFEQLCQLTPFLTGGKQRLEKLNITTVAISPSSLCPTSPTLTYIPGNKKVDLAVAIRLSDADRSVLQRGRYQVPGPVSINQTGTNFTALKPMFLHIEVKKDDRDPLIQLGTWITAEYTKRRREGYPMELPAIAIVVDKDVWTIWIAVAVPTSPGDFRVQFIGPSSMGDTTSVGGIFKILHVLKAAARWGLEIYEPVFRHKILSMYQ